MIPALGRQRQKDFSEFDASLVYKSSSRRVMMIQALPRNQTKKKNLSGESLIPEFDRGR